MRLPRNILSGNYTKPRLFLCEVDKERICELDTTDTQGSFKFNAYSELSFEVGRTYNDKLTGKTQVNPYYDKIESLRLIEIADIGYFEIQSVSVNGDGIKESKNVTVYSLEYTLSQKYLEDFYINTGETNSVEVIYAPSENNIVPVTLYNPANHKLSLLHLVLEKAYGWTIGHVDVQLQTLSRQFEVDRESIYDFLMNEVCEKFNCYIQFDTIKNIVNVYAESPTAKFIGNGVTKEFVIGDIDSTFSEIKTVSIDGYKTTKWKYGLVNGLGTLILDEAPEIDTMIEVVGVDSAWDTDVFVTFSNLSQEITIDNSSDDIKTVLTITFGEDNDIRESNLGLPYIVDLSYYTTPDWMGQDLYEAWLAYQEKCNQSRPSYTANSKSMLELSDKIWFEEGRVSLQYAPADNVTAETVGTYYVGNGDNPEYYTEVSLPAEYQVDTTYYKIDGVNLTEESARNLYYALEDCYLNKGMDKLNALITQEPTPPFAFMDKKSPLSNKKYPLSELATKISGSHTTEERNVEVRKFLDIMWDQVGRTMLTTQYLEAFTKIQVALMDSGRSNVNHVEYPSYNLAVVFTDSIDAAIDKRNDTIAGYQSTYNTYAAANQKISDGLLISNPENFTEGQRVRLNAFLREDELNLDDIVTTSQDTLSDTFKIQQDAIEAGRIELSKRSQPQLQFSMTMANIYALPEFAPMVDQFQLGNIIKIGLRPDYIKQSRLMQVNINFDDFSDFSCEFSELTNFRTQSDIHADLLKNAISAGKSVAENASYWTKGSDQATKTDLKIQQGLLDAIEAIKSNSGQSVSIDKNGIHLQKMIKQDDGTEVVDDKQCWMVNNQILFTDDGFKTSKAALGEFTIDDNTYYGLIAEAVLSGYIESTRIRGGTIQIGEQSDGTPAFAVNADGSVTMNGGGDIAGYAKTSDVEQLKENIDTAIISSTAPDQPKEGQLWIDTSEDPYVLMMYTQGKWNYFSQQTGGKIFTSQPESYSKGDMWVVDADSLYNSCKIIDDFAVNCLLNVWNNMNAEYYTKDGLRINKMNYRTISCGAPIEVEGDDPAGFVIDISLQSTSTSISSPFVVYVENCMENNCTTPLPITSITINNKSGQLLCHQDNIRHYGTDTPVNIAANSTDSLYLICSGGNIYVVDATTENKFFCTITSEQFVNATIVKAIESSSSFSYDHWVDVTPEDTTLQNNVYNNFTFDKEDGLKIGQTDSNFYVNIDSTEMGFYDNSEGKKQKVVYISNSAANIDNMIVEGSADFQCDTTFQQPVSILGFTFKKETDGSLSLL